MENANLQKLFELKALHRAYDELVSAIMHLSSLEIDVFDLKEKLYEVICKIRDLSNGY